MKATLTYVRNTSGPRYLFLVTDENGMADNGAMVSAQQVFDYLAQNWAGVPVDVQIDRRERGAR